MSEVSLVKRDVDKLEGHDAIQLWLKGKTAWNKWVNENPEASVSFEEVDFTSLASQLNFSGVNFAKYNFPNGKVSFAHANFSNLSVSFQYAKFGSGGVTFGRARFLGSGVCNFSLTDFGTGLINFGSAQFGCREISFVEAIFGSGRLLFHATEFQDSKFVFQRAQFDCKVIFSQLVNSSSIDNLSFKNCNFEDSLEISGHFNCVVDLTQAKTTSQLSISRLFPTLNRKGPWYKKKAVDIEDAIRLRRLKEIAENNKDHKSALRFHADEMRAMRWHEMDVGSSVLDMFFSALSNYGQSILRPFVALFTLIFAMTLYLVGYTFPLSTKHTDYFQWLSNMCSIDKSVWLSGFELSISNALPFIFSARAVNQHAHQALNEILPEYFGTVSLVYGGLCFLFLFLIGLGLRNRFRI